MGPDEYLKEVMSTMKKFREENILCDTILITDDQEIWAHSVVLAAVSPFLCSTFKGLGGTKAKKMRYNVSLPGCSASAVELVLQFLYSGQLAMPSVYQKADEFSRILFVCKSLGIDVGKLNGARVTFDSSLERTAASVDHWVDTYDVPLNNESSSCGGQLHKVEGILGEQETIIPSLPCNVMPNDLLSGDQNTSLDSDKMSQLSVPLLSVMVPVISKKASDNSTKVVEKNCHVSTSSQIPASRSSARLATKRSSTGEILTKGSRTKQHLTEVSWKAAINEKEKGLMLINNDANTPRSGNSENHMNVKLSTSLEEVFQPDYGDIPKCSFDACGKNNAEKLRVGEHRERERKLYSCLTCGKEFLRQRCFRKHVQSHTGNGKSHVCDKCGKVFPSITSLKVHQKAHVDGFPHVCEVCGKGYKFKRYLLIHAMTHTGTKPFLCDTCGRGFYVITNLKRHVLMWHTTIRPYVCGICGKGFITRPRLMKHEETHSGERLYNCETCGSSFTNAGNLSRHKMLHTGEKPYVCPVCLRAFTQKVTMQSHMTTHADQRVAFVCQICGKSLSKLSNLKKHLQMHSQQKPHVCEVCGKCFAVKEYLSRHAVIHNEKMHVCETCRKGYRSERALLEHYKTHSAIPCGKCGKEFAGPRALNTHMRVHLEEETLWCKVCGQGFGLQGQFDAHSKMHLR